MSVYSTTEGVPITIPPAAPGDARITLTVDWDDQGNELQGETIAISEWVIEPSLSVLTEANTDTTATITVTGAQAGTTYLVKNQVTTTSRLTKEPVSFYMRGGYRAPVARAPKAIGADIIKPYLFKWARVIGTSGVINSARVTVSPSGLSVVGVLVYQTDVYVWLGGGVAGTVYTITCTPDVAGIGNIDPAVMSIRCVAK